MFLGESKWIDRAKWEEHTLTVDWRFSTSAVRVFNTPGKILIFPTSQDRRPSSLETTVRLLPPNSSITSTVFLRVGSGGLLANNSFFSDDVAMAFIAPSNGGIAGRGGGGLDGGPSMVARDLKFPWPSEFG